MNETENGSIANLRELLVKNLPQFFRALRTGRRLILWSAGLCLVLATVYLIVSPPLHVARAKLLVLNQKKRGPLSTSADASQVLEGGGLLQEDFVPTQMAIVRSPEVVKRAIDAVGLDNLPTLKRKIKEGDNPAHLVIKRYLKVSRPERMAKVMQLEYAAGSEGEAVQMLEAITASYRKFLAEHYERDDYIVAVIEKARGELNGELAQAEQKYAEFRQKHPLVSTDKEGRSLLTGRLARWDNARNELRVREVQLRGQLELGRTLAGEGAGLWAIAHIMGQLSGESGEKNGLLAYSTNVAQMTSWDHVKQLSLEQQELAERYGPQYSKVQELQERIGRIQERVRSSRRDVEGADIKDLLKALEQGVKASEAIRAELDRGFMTDKSQESDLIEETRLRTEVERRMTLFNFMLTQLKQAEFARDFDAINTQAVETPNVPDRGIWRRYLVVLLLGLFFGLAAGVALALGKEMLPSLLRPAFAGVYSHEESIAPGGAVCEDYRACEVIPNGNGDR